MVEPFQFKVLLIEDDPEDAFLIRELLKDASLLQHFDSPFAVERAARLAEGIEILRQGNFDVLLLDLNLPDSTGLNTYTRAQAAAPDLPVILFSGNQDDHLSIQAIASGAQDYLVKGRVAPADLGRAIRYAIERTRARKTLRASESRFRALADASPAAIFITSLAGETLYVNPRWCEMTGLSPAEARGQGRLKAIYAEDLPLVSTWLEELKSGQTWHNEYRYQHKSGAIFWVDGGASPIIDGEGRVTGYLGTEVNITERKTRQGQLTLLTTALEAAANGVVITDLGGAIVWVNPAFTALTGYSAQEAYFKNPRQLVKSGVQGTEFYQEMWRTILEGRVWRGELINQRKDGSRYIEDMTITPVRAQGGPITHFIAVKEDISSRKQMEDALQWDLRLTGALAELYVPLVSATATIEDIAAAVLCHALELTDSRSGYVSSLEEVTGRSNCHIHWTPAPGAPHSDPLDDRRIVAEGQLLPCPGLCKLPLQPETPFYSNHLEGSPFLVAPLADEPHPQRLLFMPVAGEQQTVGYICLSDPTREYTDRDLNAIRRLAEYYALAVQRRRADLALRQARDESQRLFEAERKQRQFAETISEVSQKLVGDESFFTVLDGMLDQVSRVLPHDASHFVLVEGNIGHVIKGHGYENFGSWDVVRDAPFEIDKTHDLAEMARTLQPNLIPDTNEYPGWVHMPGREWVRSYVEVPIIIEGKLFGYISLDSATPRFFTLDALERLRIFGDLATLALQKAHLLDETRRRLADLQTVNRISTSLRSVGRVDEMLDLLLDEMLSDLGTDTGSVWLFEPARAGLVQVTARGFFARLAGQTIGVGEGIIGHVYETAERYRSQDIVNDPLFLRSLTQHVPEGRCGIWVPVRTSREVVGVMVAARPNTGHFSSRDEEMLATLAEIAGNAILRMRLYEQTEKRLKYLSALREIDIAIANNRDLHSTLSILLDQTRTQLGIDAASVLLYDPPSNSLEYAAGRGFLTQMIESARLQVGQGTTAGRAALERRIVHIPDLATERSSLTRLFLLSGEKFFDYYALPLLVKGELKGVLEIFHRSPLHVQPDWLDFLESLAGQAAIAIETAQLFEGLRRSRLELALAYESTLEGWSRTLDLRDKETEGHTQRVTEMTLRLARLSGFNDTAQANIRRGSLLHDIGKIAIPDAILSKPGPLDEEEWKIMRLHPVYAYEILAPIEYLHPALDIPYCHHERWDGKGYPRGLKGEQIPKAARLFSVVDVWDALSSDRPYRKAWAPGRVREYLCQESGAQFDPKSVDLFLSIIEEKRP